MTDPTHPERDALVVGVVAKPHGLRGELRLHPYNMDSSAWDQPKALFVVQGGKRVRFTKAKRGGKFVIARLPGINSREDADAIRGLEVCIPRDAVPLEEDEYFLADLEGLDVIQGEEVVGEVIRVWEYPSSICVEVRTQDGICEIPLLEPWVEAIDIEGGCILIGDISDIPMR